MSGIFGSVLGSLGKMVGGNPLGSILGIMGVINQMQMASKEKKALDQSLWYSKHPEAIAAIARKLQQPLSAGLTKGTENIVSANLAEQGLSEAPGIQASVLTQALAPYQIREQEMAMTAALRAIGLPTEALANLRSTGSESDLASLLQLVLPKQNPAATQTDPTDLSGLSPVGINVPDVQYPPGTFPTDQTGGFDPSKLGPI